jgi:hypothetical protein
MGVNNLKGVILKPSFDTGFPVLADGFRFGLHQITGAGDQDGISGVPWTR